MSVEAHAWMGEGDTDNGFGPGVSNNPSSHAPNARDDAGGHRGNWLDSLARGFRDLLGNPGLMDHHGRLPGEPGYRSPTDFSGGIGHPSQDHRSDNDAENN